MAWYGSKTPKPSMLIGTVIWPQRWLGWSVARSRAQVFEVIAGTWKTWGLGGQGCTANFANRTKSSLGWIHGGSRRRQLTSMEKPLCSSLRRHIPNPELSMYIYIRCFESKIDHDHHVRYLIQVWWASTEANADLSVQIWTGCGPQATEIDGVVLGWLVEHRTGAYPTQISTFQPCQGGYFKVQVLGCNEKAWNQGGKASSNRVPLEPLHFGWGWKEEGPTKLASCPPWWDLKLPKSEIQEGRFKPTFQFEWLWEAAAFC